MNKKCIPNLRWLLCCLIFLGVACNNQKSNKAIKLLNDSLQFEKNVKIVKNNLLTFKQKIYVGDVITRAGNDFTSQSIKTLNRRDKTFSHCGIANIENDTLFIYHAIGGEYNPNQKIKRECFEDFANPNENNAIGIFRFDIAKDVNKKVVKQAQYYFHEKILFDLDFDLKTDNKMYCAEYIYKSFLVASDSLIKFSISHIEKFEFVGVDDIILSTLAKKIEVYNYKLY